MKKSGLIFCSFLFFFLSLSLSHGQSYGDVDHDGNINIIDALLVSQYYVGLNPQGVDMTLMDVSADGLINIIDALLIAQYYVGLITEFPIQAQMTPAPTPGTIPVYAARSVSIEKDTDLTYRELAGMVTIRRATDETDIGEYVLYWGLNASTKTGPPLAALQATGSDITYAIPANTTIPQQATHLLVYTRNARGEMATGVSTPFSDIVGNRYTGPGDEVFHVSIPGVTSINYELDLGSYNRDVYFIFTNTGTSNVTSPTVAASGAAPLQIQYIPEKDFSMVDDYSTEPVIQRGNPFIDEFNRNSFAYITGNSTLHGEDPVKDVLEPPEEPQRDAVNNTRNFMYNSTASTIPSTCRAVVTNNTKTLNIWVANDCWTSGGYKRNLVTQQMVNAIGSSFLRSGTDNDIYDWVTNIYGPEWGSHNYPSALINSNNEITILLYDIDNDNSTNGGVVGFFWAKDNFLRSQYSYSNERIMFYIDAVMFATPTGGSWEPGDFWPSTMIGTLAHEFQHMIHYYQKGILRTGGSSSETWINEMCSEVTEDFVATKLGIDGPRGVAHTNGTGGSNSNQSGRLPRYVYYNDISLTDWGGRDTLASYSIAYAYGAYLARNFGGVSLFRNIVQNSNTDYSAISTGLSGSGYGETFQTSMTKWAAANLLSDNANAPVNYRYNTGGFINSTIGGITYNLGSINLYNYYYSGNNQTGPFIHTSSPITGWGSHLNVSNLYYRAGDSVSGTFSRTLTYGQNVQVSIVVKEND